MQGVFPLIGQPQYYAWGGQKDIADFVGIDNSAQQTIAEWWMGAHIKAPSFVVVNDKHISLRDFIAQNRSCVLGQDVLNDFGDFPFLFKVLDVSKMLSIQVHPSKEEAEIGFRRENQLKIPLAAPNRNYKDTNHKPELMLAMSDFWLLHGFKQKAIIQQLLANTPEFHFLHKYLIERGTVRALYQYIMEMPQQKVDELLAPLHKRLEKEQPTDKDLPDYWALQAIRDYTVDGHYDRGVFSIYLYNLVHLKKGEAIFQDAGIPHAYLEGLNLELMANSDNVFRGGLTPKHVDVPELMRHIKFEGIIPEVIGEKKAENYSYYPSSAPDFELRKLTLQPQQTIKQQIQGPTIALVLKGEVSVNSSMNFKRGQSFFVTHDTPISLQGNAVIYQAVIPTIKNKLHTI